MTTAWAHLMRGQWFEAGRANVGGALLGLLAMLASPWLLASAVRGAWLGFTPTATGVGWVAFVVLFVTLIDWSIRLFRG
jgi:hypothetical protein